MMIEKHEVILKGEWVYTDGKISEDLTCQKIQRLITYELSFIKGHPNWGAWPKLFQDPADKRFWELSFPQSELHGGGPPMLKQISNQDADEKYKLTV